jgi:glycosyltransferase involved in cell wall biosynthesis
MKLLFINHHTWSKSVHRATELARQLVKHGHSVTLMVISDQNRFLFHESLEEGVEVIHSPDLLSGRLRTGWDPYCALARLLKLVSTKSEYDLVYLFETRPATILPGMVFAKLRGIPMIIDWIDWWGRGGLITVNRPKWYRYLFGWIETFFEEQFRRFGKGNTVISKGLFHRAQGLGINEKDLLLLRPGINGDGIEQLSTFEARQRLRMGHSGFLVGFGSQDTFLDMSELVKGFRLFSQNEPSAKLLILGKVTNQLKRSFREHELEHLVIMPGFVSHEDYPYYLQACNTLVVPFSEKNYNLGRWPNKFGDYLLSGRPIVFNAYGDLKDFVRDDGPGINCEFHAEAFQNSFARLAADVDLQTTLGKNARRICEFEFRWGDRINSLVVFMHKVLAK